MEEPFKQVEAFFDLTLDSDEEDVELKPPILTKYNDDKSPLKNSDSDSDIKGTLSPRICQSKVSSPSKSKTFKRLEKSLEKAIQDIKKGGSLLVVSQQYKIPEAVLYDKLVSRTLPKETDMLTKLEENNLVKWIIRTNKKNKLIFKHELMEKVGKLKKVIKISPIFHKSKFGKMWYEGFMRRHREISENDGLLLHSDDDNNHTSFSWPDEEDIKLAQQAFKIEPTEEVKKDLTDLLLSFGIKDAVVVLHDFRKLKTSPLILNEKENIPMQLGEDKPEVQIKCEEHAQIKNEEDIEIESKEMVQINCEEEGCKFEVNGDEYDPFSDVMDCKNIKSEHIVKICSDLLHNTLEKEETNNNTRPNRPRPQCPKCDRTFSDKGKLQRHLPSHIPKELYSFTCTKCLKRFSSRYRLIVHLNTSHSTRYFKCSKCDKIFKHQTSVINHRRRVHGNFQNLPKELSRPTGSNFICDMCGKSFKYKNSLEAHIMYGHLKQEKPISCTICKKRFEKLSAMVRHSLKHSKKKPFSCAHCSRTFSRKYLLREHIECCSKKTTCIKLKCEQLSKENI